MTPALHARLVAAVQQRLDVARAAGVDSPHWAEHSSFFADLLDPLPSQRRNHPGYVPMITREDAAHIAANDPATVIRHCERDLRVLERHEPCTGEHTPAQVAMAWDLARVNYRHQVPWCHRCWAPAPCEVLIDEAFAYDVAVEVDRG